MPCVIVLFFQCLAEIFTTIVQFMTSCDGEIDYVKFHINVQSSLAHGFCLLVQLLIDKNSSVCARAKYLILSIKESSLEVCKKYLIPVHIYLCDLLIASSPDCVLVVSPLLLALLYRVKGLAC